MHSTAMPRAIAQGILVARDCAKDNYLGSGNALAYNSDGLNLHVETRLGQSVDLDQ